MRALMCAGMRPSGSRHSRDQRIYVYSKPPTQRRASWFAQLESALRNSRALPSGLSNFSATSPRGPSTLRYSNVCSVFSTNDAIASARLFLVLLSKAFLMLARCRGVHGLRGGSSATNGFLRGMGKRLARRREALFAVTIEPQRAGGVCRREACRDNPTMPASFFDALRVAAPCCKRRAPCCARCVRAAAR